MDLSKCIVHGPDLRSGGPSERSIWGVRSISSYVSFRCACLGEGDRPEYGECSSYWQHPHRTLHRRYLDEGETSGRKVHNPSPISDGWRGSRHSANMTDDKGWQKPISLMACRCGRVFDSTGWRYCGACPPHYRGERVGGSSRLANAHLYSITAKQARHYLAFPTVSFDLNAVPWALYGFVPKP